MSKRKNIDWKIGGKAHDEARDVRINDDVATGMASWGNPCNVRGCRNISIYFFVDGSDPIAKEVCIDHWNQLT